MIEKSVRGVRHSITLAAANEAEALEALRLFQLKHGVRVTATIAPASREKKVEPGLVYFIRSGGAVKIGFTTDVEKRLAALRVGAAEGLMLLGLVKGTRETERRLHAHFEAFRMHGEWFRAAPELVDFIGLANRELAA